jgi:hypothetical protein
VEHQLNGHEDGDNIAPQQESQDAQREQNRTEDQVPGRRNSAAKDPAVSIDLLRASTMAQNGDQNQDAGHFKGEQVYGEKALADLRAAALECAENYWADGGITF